MRFLPLLVFISCATVAAPALSNERDDAINRALVTPTKNQEYKETMWRECLSEHHTEERLAAFSHLVVMNRELLSTTREEVAHFQMRRDHGEAVDSLAEADANKRLQEYQNNLKKSWAGYKNAGGAAESVDKVVEIARPCGPPPSR
jgi:hypothetical protein